MKTVSTIVEQYLIIRVLKVFKYFRLPVHVKELHSSKAVVKWPLRQIFCRNSDS